MYLDSGWKCSPNGYLEINLLRTEIHGRRGLQPAKYPHNVPSNNY